MARVQYTPPGGSPIELLTVRTNDFQLFTERDPSGVDRLATRCELDVSFQWHPFATASNTGNAAAPPFDPIGVSLAALQQGLSTDRGLFRYAVGNNLVFEVPGIDAATGLRLPCDPGNGPKVKLLGLSQIMGDNLAAGRWKITFWVTGCSNILLSNRWTISADTDSCGMTTRTVEGWATMRADAIRPFSGINNVDDFRRWLFCPVPSGFRRDKIRVRINEIGTVCNYLAIDVQDMNPLGATGGGVGAVEFEGEYTAGITSAVRTHQGLIESKIGQAALGNIMSVAGMTGSAFAKIGAAMLSGLLPVAEAHGWCTIRGGKLATKANLLSIATQILLDRAGGATPVQAIGTQGFGNSEKDGRFAKVSMAFLPNLIPLANQNFSVFSFRGMANYANDIKLIGGIPPATLPGDMPPDETNPAYKNFNLPNGKPAGATNNDGGTRGSWLGALFVQALNTQCEPPDAPPANALQSTEANLV